MIDDNKTLKDCEEFNDNPFIKLLLDNEQIQPRKKNVVKRETMDREDGGEGLEVPVFSGDAIYFWFDGRKYSKVFSQNVGLIKGLSSCAMQMFFYILENATVNRDVVYVKPKDFLTFTGMSSRSQYYLAVLELINKKVIAKTKSSGSFFINPLVVFNGNVASILPDSYLEFGRRFVNEKKALKPLK